MINLETQKLVKPNSQRPNMAKSHKSRHIKIIIGLTVLGSVLYLAFLLITINRTDDKARSQAAFARMRRNSTSSKFLITSDTLHAKSKYDPVSEVGQETHRVIKEVFKDGKIEIENAETSMDGDKVKLANARTVFQGQPVSVDGQVKSDTDGLHFDARMTSKDPKFIQKTISKTSKVSGIGNIASDQALTDSQVTFSTKTGLAIDATVDATKNKALLSLFGKEDILISGNEYIPSAICNDPDNIQKYREFKATLEGNLKPKELPTLKIKNLPDICLGSVKLSGNEVQMKLLDDKNKNKNYEYTFSSVLSAKDLPFSADPRLFPSSQSGEQQYKMTGNFAPNKATTLTLKGSLGDIKFVSPYEKAEDMISLKDCSLYLIIAPAKANVISGHLKCGMKLLLFEEMMSTESPTVSLGTNHAMININRFLRSDSTKDKNSNRSIIIQTDSTISPEEKLTLLNPVFRVRNGLIYMPLIQSKGRIFLGDSDMSPIKCQAVGTLNSNKDLVMVLTCRELNNTEFGVKLKNTSLIYRKLKQSENISSQSTNTVTAEFDTLFDYNRKQYHIKQKISSLNDLFLELDFSSEDIQDILRSNGTSENEVYTEITNFILDQELFSQVKTAKFLFAKKSPYLRVDLETQTTPEKNLMLDRMTMKELHLAHLTKHEQVGVSFGFWSSNLSINDLLTSLGVGGLATIGWNRLPFYTVRFNKVKLAIGKILAPKLHSEIINGLSFKTYATIAQLLGSKTLSDDLNSKKVSLVLLANMTKMDYLSRITIKGSVGLSDFVKLKKLEWNIKENKISPITGTVEFQAYMDQFDLTQLNGSKIKVKTAQSTLMVLEFVDTVSLGSEQLSHLVLEIKKENEKITHTLQGQKTFVQRNQTFSKQFVMHFPQTSKEASPDSVVLDSEVQKPTQTSDCPSLLKDITPINNGKIKLVIKSLNPVLKCVTVELVANLFGKTYKVELRKISGKNIESKIVGDDSNRQSFILTGTLTTDNPLFKKPLTITLDIPFIEESNGVDIVESGITVTISGSLQVFGQTLDVKLNNLNDTRNPTEIRLQNLHLPGDTIVVQNFVITYDPNAKNFTSQFTLVIRDTLQTSLEGTFNKHTGSFLYEGYVRDLDLPGRTAKQNDLVLLKLNSDPFEILLETDIEIGDLNIKGNLKYDSATKKFNVNFPVIEIGPYVHLSNIQLTNTGTGEFQEVYTGLATIGDCGKETPLICLDDLSVTVRKNQERLDVFGSSSRLTVELPLGMVFTLSDFEFSASKPLYATLNHHSTQLLNFPTKGAVSSSLKLVKTRAEVQGTGVLQLKEGKESKVSVSVKMEEVIDIQIRAEDTEYLIEELLDGLGLDKLQDHKQYFQQRPSEVVLRVTRIGDTSEVLVYTPKSQEGKGDLLFFVGNGGNQLHSGKTFAVSMVQEDPVSISKLMGVDSILTISNFKVMITNCASKKTCSQLKETNERISGSFKGADNVLTFQGKLAASSLKQSMEGVAPVLEIAPKSTTDSLIDVKGKVTIQQDQQIPDLVLEAVLSNIEIGDSVSLSTYLLLQKQGQLLDIKLKASLSISQNEYLEETRIDLDVTYDPEWIKFGLIAIPVPAAKTDMAIQPEKSFSIKYNQVSLVKIENINIDIQYERKTRKFTTVKVKGEVCLPKSSRKLLADFDLYKPSEIQLGSPATQSETKELSLTLRAEGFSMREVVEKLGQDSLPDLERTENEVTDKMSIKDKLSAPVQKVQLKVITGTETFILIDIEADDLFSKTDKTKLHCILIVQQKGQERAATFMMQIDSQTDTQALSDLSQGNKTLQDIHIFNGLLIFSYYSDLDSIERLRQILFSRSETEQRIMQNCSHIFTGPNGSLLNTTRTSLETANTSLFVCLSADLKTNLPNLLFGTELSLIGYLDKHRLLLAGSLTNVKIVAPKKGIDLDVSRADLYLEKSFDSEEYKLLANIEGAVRIAKKTTTKDKDPLNSEWADFHGFIDFSNDNLYTQIQVEGSLHLAGQVFMKEAKLSFAFRKNSNEQADNYLRADFRTETESLPADLTPATELTELPKGQCEVKLFLDLREVGSLTEEFSNSLTDMANPNSLKTPIGILLVLRASNIDFSSLLPHSAEVKKSFGYRLLSKIKIEKSNFVLNTLKDHAETTTDGLMTDLATGLADEESLEDSLDEMKNAMDVNLETLLVSTDLEKYPKGITFNLEGVQFGVFKGSATFHYNKGKDLFLYLSLAPIEIKYAGLSILKIGGKDEQDPNFEMALAKQGQTVRLRIKGSVYILGVIGGAAVIERDDLKEANVWNLKGTVRVLINYDARMKICGDDILKPRKVYLRLYATESSFHQMFDDIDKKLSEEKDELEKALNSEKIENKIESDFIKEIERIQIKKQEVLQSIFKAKQISEPELISYYQYQEEKTEQNEKIKKLRELLEKLRRKNKEDQDEVFRNTEAEIENVQKIFSETVSEFKRTNSFLERLSLKIKGSLFKLKVILDPRVTNLQLKIAKEWAEYALKKSRYYVLKAVGGPMLSTAKWIVRILSLGQALLSVESLEALIDDFEEGSDRQIARVTMVVRVLAERITVKEEAELSTLTSYWAMTVKIIILLVKVITETGVSVIKRLKSLVPV